MEFGTLPGTEMGLLYRVKRYAKSYEPIFISRKISLDFDERFVGYGSTRKSQIFEMFSAGYTFYVLNNAFLVHWGFQTRNEYTDAR